MLYFTYGSQNVFNVTENMWDMKRNSFCLKTVVFSTGADQAVVNYTNQCTWNTM